MLILGIDPGFKATGYGVIKVHNNSIKLIETGVIAPKQKDSIGNRLKTVYTLLDEIVVQHKPSVLVLEKIYAHHKYTTTASILGHVRGVICLLTAQRGIELAEHSVKRIRKAVTGNGNATKQQTQKVVAHILGIDDSKLTLDASDALALALGYVHMHSRSL